MTPSSGAQFTAAPRTFRLPIESPVPVLDAINSAVTGFAAGAPQADDITVLVLRYTGA